MRKLLTLAGISLLSGAAFARAPEPSIEINIDVLQGMIAPPEAEATPSYKPSAEKPVALPKTAKPCQKKLEAKKPTKKKKQKKAKATKQLPRPEFIKKAPAVIVPMPVEVAPPAAPIVEEVKPVEALPIVEEIKPTEEVAPTPEPVKEAAKLPLKDRVLYKLQDWAVAVDVWRRGLKDRLMRKSAVAPVAPQEAPVQAPAVDAPKTVDVMKVEKPQQPVPAPQAIAEIKPEPFVIPADEAPVEKVAPVAEDLAPQEAVEKAAEENVSAPAMPETEIVLAVEKKETAFQSLINKWNNWKNNLRQKLNEKKPVAEPIKPALPEAPPAAVEPEKSALPENPPAAVEATKDSDKIASLPSAPPVTEKVTLPDVPPVVAKAEKELAKLPDAPPIATAKPQNILPEAPPVPATVIKNTGALYVIPFGAESDEIALQEQGYLLALVQRMKQDESLRIAVQGFAPLNNGQEYEARRLSLKRAVGVRQFLMDKGADAARMNVQALGSVTEESMKDRVDILRIN